MLGVKDLLKPTNRFEKVMLGIGLAGMAIGIGMKIAKKVGAK